MNLIKRHFLFVLILGFILGCSPSPDEFKVQTVTGLDYPDIGSIWLSHEHILVDFIGADSIQPQSWDTQQVKREIMPYLSPLKKHQVAYFVDATPNFLGRDVHLLQAISRETGIKILTTTGLYGARNHLFLPEDAFAKTAEELATMWTDEFRNGIEGTTVKPGFIKISVNALDTLLPVDAKLVKAAGLTHLNTGLTVGSHTGPAKAMWPQLEILKGLGVAPEAFIWIHSQNEENNNEYIQAAKAGCWISLDGLGWETDKHLEKLIFTKEKGILDHILISHDAGWFDPQKKEQKIQPYTNIFENLIPKLLASGFSEKDIQMLLCVNPVRAFSIKVRKL